MPTTFQAGNGQTSTIAKPAVMPRETFDAFWISESPMTGIGAMRPLFESADNMQAAIELAVLRCAHKGKFAIRHTNNLTGASLVHIYTVRQKSRAVPRFHDHQTKMVHDRYGELLVVLDGELFK